MYECLLARRADKSKRSIKGLPLFSTEGFITCYSLITWKYQNHVWKQKSTPLFIQYSERKRPLFILHSKKFIFPRCSTLSLTCGVYIWNCIMHSIQALHGCDICIHVTWHFLSTVVWKNILWRERRGRRRGGRGGGGGGGGVREERRVQLIWRKTFFMFI